jgi:hypothetical protein
MTHLHPDARPKQVKAYRSMFGGGGRPPKGYRPRFYKCLPEVEKALKLRKAGRSYQEIADEVGRPRATIQTWCKNYVYEFDDVCIQGDSYSAR